MSAAREPTVIASAAGAVTTVTMNRPASLNSMTATMAAELLAALDRAAADRSVRCVVLTGAGRGFCAGQDLAELSAGPQPPDLGALLAASYRPLVARIRSMPVPLVAAVNGVAAGAGASLALACDIVVAAESASFIQAFARIGLIPDAGGTWLLPRLVGRARACGLAMLGDPLGAGEAERIGLIWRCASDDEFDGDVAALAARLASMPTAAMVAIRESLDATAALDLLAAFDVEAEWQSRLGAAHDHREGVTAFVEKRTPRFFDRTLGN